MPVPIVRRPISKNAAQLAAEGKIISAMRTPRVPAVPTLVAPVPKPVAPPTGVAPPPPVTTPRGPAFDGPPPKSGLDSGAGTGSINVGGGTAADFEAVKSNGRGIKPRTGGLVSDNVRNGAPRSNEDFDKAASNMLYNEINQAGNVDTKAEEDLINEQMNDRIGAALVDQRASMGRSGFGSSGAMAAMEGDTQRTARQQGLEDVLGLRRTEDQRATDNATKAIGSELSMRKQAEAEAKQAALLKEIGKGNEDINADDDGPRSNPNGTEKDLDQATEDKYEAAPKRGLQTFGDRQIGNVVIDGVAYGVFHSNDANGENDDEGTYLVESWYQNPNDPKNQES